MLPRFRPLVPAFVVIAFLVSGCDPGFAYSPVGEDGKRVERWSETVDGVRLEMTSFMDLTPIYYFRGYLRIENDSDRDVAVVGAWLEMNGRILEAEPVKNRAEEGDRTVPKGKSLLVSLDWDIAQFKDGERDDLGPSITWIWKVRIGSEAHVVRVKMNKES